MQVYILAQGCDTWDAIENGYTIPSSPPTNEKGKKLDENDAKTKNFIISGLSKSIYVKVLGCKRAKEIWGEIQSIYEGDSKVKEEKLQICRTQFEQLNMREDENIATYFHRVKGFKISSNKI